MTNSNVHQLPPPEPPTVTDELIAKVAAHLLELDRYARRIRAAADDLDPGPIELAAGNCVDNHDDIVAAVATYGRAVAAIADTLWRDIFGAPPPFDPDWLYAEVDR